MTQPTRTAGPARLAVAEWLREKIITGEIPEREFLDEKWVCEQLEVSRTPVREAFQVLAAEHFLTLLPRKGAQVTGVTLTELGEMYQVRRLIEGEAVRTICARGEGAPPEMAALLGRLEDAAARMDFYAETVADRRFHLALVSGAGNSILTEVYEGLRARQQRVAMRALRARPERLPTIETEHRRLVECLEANDAPGAMEVLSDHLRVVSEVAAALDT